MQVDHELSILNEILYMGCTDFLRGSQTWPRVNKTFFMLNSTGHGIQLLIKSKMLKNKDFSGFQILRCCIYHANKC